MVQYENIYFKKFFIPKEKQSDMAEAIINFITEMQKKKIQRKMLTD